MQAGIMCMDAQQYAATPPSIVYGRNDRENQPVGFHRWSSVVTQRFMQVFSPMQAVRLLARGAMLQVCWHRLPTPLCVSSSCVQAELSEAEAKLASERATRRAQLEGQRGEAREMHVSQGKVLCNKPSCGPTHLSAPQLTRARACTSTVSWARWRVESMDGSYLRYAQRSRRVGAPMCVGGPIHRLFTVYFGPSEPCNQLFAASNRPRRSATGEAQTADLHS